MKPATLLLVTFTIWLAAKGRLHKYWELATVSGVENNSTAAPGSDLSDASSLPGFNINGGGGW